MRRILISAAVAAAALATPLALHAPLAQTASAAAPKAVARVIVKFRADSTLLRKQALSATTQSSQQATALGQRIGMTLTAGRSITDRSHVVFGSGMTSQQLAARIAAESDVEFAYPDERKHIVEVPNDPFYAAGPTVGSTSGGPAVGQWYLKPPGAAGDAANTAPAAINAQQAWDVAAASALATIVVADLDTGLRFDHPDLQGGNVIPGYDMISPDSPGVFTTAADGSGRDADASDPGDFVSVAEATTGCPQSASSWHGTQTAGLIGAATNNTIGMASVSHGNVKVMPVRVLGKCGGFDSDIQAGMLWAVGIAVPGTPTNTTPARVLNMSLGGAAACGSYASVISQVNGTGAVVVVSAGNSGGNGVSSPANCPGAIGVTALRHVGDKVGYSDLGPEITISAPGGNCVTTTTGTPCLYPIMTTSNSGTTTPVAAPAGAIYTDAFNASLGTSFSAPLVSGTVALMLAIQPTLTPAQIATKLKASARPFPTTGGSTASIPTCTSSSTSQDECYCPNPIPNVVGALCGAGMLDTHAALLSISGVQASISLTTTTPTAGQAAALTSDSVVGAGQSIVSYAWTILNAGTTGATITGANNGASVVVTPTAGGSFVIQLKTTDSTGFTSVANLSVSVAGPVTQPTSTPSGGSSGGGGALGAGWLLLLLAAVLSLALTSARERRARAALSAAARDAGKR